VLDKGYIQVYTGNGKGKTTAAFGAALRAAGQGNKVLIYQFLKPPSLDIGERFSLKLGAVKIRVESLDIEWEIGKSFKDKEKIRQTKKAIRQVLERIVETAEKRFYDVIILDEIVFCLSKGLADFEDIKRLIGNKDERVEIIMTGRDASKKLIEIADMVTEMKKVKHTFDKGIKARRGIEY
jgi:cob(I)alamin adenosyltransferase